MASSKITTVDIISFIVTILLLIFYFWSRVGMIAAIKTILDKESITLKQAFKISRPFYMRLVMITVLIMITWIVLGLILVQPVVYLVHQGHPTQAWILGTFAGLIAAVVIVVTLLVMSLAPMFVVIFHLKARDSIDQSFGLIKHFFWQLLGFGLILIALELLPFVLLSFLTYDNHSFIIEIIGLIIFTLIETVLIVFAQTAWVIAFLDLIRPQKIEDTEVLPEPEAAS